MAGLLSSGHYTETRPITSEDQIKFGTQMPLIIRTDYGKEWKEDGFSANRHCAVIVEDAMDLVDELVRQSIIDDKQEIPSETRNPQADA